MENEQHGHNENNERRQESVYSKRIKAGKRRTYFFDVRETRGSDFYLTITESRKRFDSDGYDRHKIFLYKEDFNKFIKGLGEAMDYVKTELMPDFDFDAFNHDTPYEGDENGQHRATPSDSSAVTESAHSVGDTTPASEENSYSSDKPETPSIAQDMVANETQSPDVATGEAPDNGKNEEVDKW